MLAAVVSVSINAGEVCGFPEAFEVCITFAVPAADVPLWAGFVLEYVRSVSPAGVSVAIDGVFERREGLSIAVIVVIPLATLLVTLVEARVVVTEDWVSVDDAKAWSVVCADSTVPLSVVTVDSNLLVAVTDAASSVPVVLLVDVDDSVICMVGKDDVELPPFAVGLMLCKEVDAASPSADAVFVVPFVARTELKARVDSFSAWVVPVVGERAVELPLA